MKIITLLFLLMFSAGCVEPEENISRTEKALISAPCGPSVPESPLPQGTFTTSQGHSYTYFYYVPDSYSHTQGEYPLVLNFHGGQQTAKIFSEKEFMRQFRRQADNVGAILVWLDSGVATKTWNDSVFPNPLRNHRLMVDEFIAETKTLFSIDDDRIHALGFSNGAMFVQRLAATRSDTFASVVSIAGRSASAFNNLPAQTVWGSLPLTSPIEIDIMMIRGGLDPKVPISGPGTIGPSVGTYAVTNPVYPGWSDYELWKDATNCTTNALGVGVTYETHICLGSNEVRHDLVPEMIHAIPTMCETAYDGPKQSADFLWAHTK